MLYAVVAVLIPIIIEWLFRKRKRQIELPTIRYLLRNKEQEKIKRQDRLLLILRMLAIFLLVLAVSRPLIKRSVEEGDDKVRRHVVVFLDGTASMQQKVGITTAFGWAQRNASAMIRELPENAVITVGYLSGAAREVVIGEKDRHTAAARIEALNPGSCSARMAQGLAWIKQALVTRETQKAREAEEREKAKKRERKKKLEEGYTEEQLAQEEAEAGAADEEELEEKTEIYIFSDFQKTTWPGADGTTIRESLAELSGANDLYLVDVGGVHKFNYIVTDVQPSERILSARMPVTFRVDVDVKSETAEDIPEDATATLTLLVNGKPKPPIELGRITGKTTRTFVHTFEEDGEYVVKAVLDGDQHRGDNEFRYVAQVPDSLRVLILDDTAEDPAPESFFLQKAVFPEWQRGLPKVSHFSAHATVPWKIVYENLDFAVREYKETPEETEARVKKWERERDRKLAEGYTKEELAGEEAEVKKPTSTFKTEGYVGIIVLGSEQLREDIVARLAQYAANGGNLWFFLGEKVKPASYNPLMYREEEKNEKGELVREELKLLPCRLVGRPRAVVPTPPGPGEEPEPVVPAFAKAKVEGTPAVPDFNQRPVGEWGVVRKYMDLEVPDPKDDPEVKVFLRFSDDQPALVRRKFGRGQVWLANMTAGLGWWDLPARPEFLVFVQTFLRHVIGDPDGRANLRVGKEFNEWVFASKQQLLLHCPDGRSRRLKPAKGAEIPWEIKFRGTEHQGRYVIEPGQAELTRCRFVVNHDGRETDLARHTEDDVARDFGAGRPDQWTWVPRKTDLADFVKGLHEETEVAPGLLWTLAAVLAVESFLAARFGRRRGGATA